MGPRGVVEESRFLVDPESVLLGIGGVWAWRHDQAADRNMAVSAHWMEAAETGRGDGEGDGGAGGLSPPRHFEGGEALR